MHKENDEISSAIRLAGCEIHVLASTMTFLNQAKAGRVLKHLSDLSLVGIMLLLKFLQNIIKPYKASYIQ